MVKKILFKALAFFFGLGFIGGLSETYEIITSNAPDIASQRIYLILMAFGMLFIMIFLTVFFWKKSKTY